MVRVVIKGPVMMVAVLVCEKVTVIRSTTVNSSVTVVVLVTKSVVV